MMITAMMMPTIDAAMPPMTAALESKEWRGDRYGERYGEVQEEGESMGECKRSIEQVYTYTTIQWF